MCVPWVYTTPLKLLSAPSDISLNLYTTFSCHPPSLADNIWTSGHDLRSFFKNFATSKFHNRLDIRWSVIFFCFEWSRRQIVHSPGGISRYSRFFLNGWIRKKVLWFSEKSFKFFLNIDGGLKILFITLAPSRILKWYKIFNLVFKKFSHACYFWRIIN